MKIEGTRSTQAKNIVYERSTGTFYIHNDSKLKLSLRDVGLSSLVKIWRDEHGDLIVKNPLPSLHPCSNRRTIPLSEKINMTRIDRYNNDVSKIKTDKHDEYSINHYANGKATIEVLETSEPAQTNYQSTALVIGALSLIAATTTSAIVTSDILATVIVTIAFATAMFGISIFAGWKDNPAPGHTVKVITLNDMSNSDMSLVRKFMSNENTKRDTVYRLEAIEQIEDSGADEKTLKEQKHVVMESFSQLQGIIDTSQVQGNYLAESIAKQFKQ